MLTRQNLLGHQYTSTFESINSLLIWFCLCNVQMCVLFSVQFDFSISYITDRTMIYCALNKTVNL